MTTLQAFKRKQHLKHCLEVRGNVVLLAGNEARFHEALQNFAVAQYDCAIEFEFEQLDNPLVAKDIAAGEVTININLTALRWVPQYPREALPDLGYDIKQLVGMRVLIHKRGVKAFLIGRVTSISGAFVDIRVERNCHE